MASGGRKSWGGGHSREEEELLSAVTGAAVVEMKSGKGADGVEREAVEWFLMSDVIDVVRMMYMCAFMIMHVDCKVGIYLYWSYMCTCVCMYIYICTHLYTYIHICLYMHICIYIYTCMYIRIFVYMFVIIHVCI